MMETAPLGTPRTRNLRHRVEVRTRKETLGGWKRTRGAVDKAQKPSVGSRDRSVAGKKRRSDRKGAHLAHLSGRTARRG